MQVRAALVGLFRLTRREYFLDFYITPPLTIALTAASLRGAGLSFDWAAAFLAGVIAWTLYEYAVHRWVSHGWFFFRDVHALHHDDQRDYIAIHPAITLTIYAALWLTFGRQSSAGALGFSAGYVIYSAAHTAFHYADIKPGGLLFRAKRHHALHHAFPNVNFGVTSPLWDRAFGTYRRIGD